MKREKLVFKTIILALLILAVAGICAAKVKTPSEFKKWLNSTGTPGKSVSGRYEADFNTYSEYNLIVYGQPEDVSGNEKRDGEYRYLGFTYMESKYTNNCFPNDETWINKPEQWDYIHVDGASESWDLIEQSIQKPYMLHTTLKGHGASKLTACDIGTGKAKVQSPANWTDSGSVYTQKSNGFYATFIIPPMGRGYLTAELECAENEIYTGDGTVNLNLKVSINKPVAQVRYIKTIFDEKSGGKVRFFHKTNSINITHSVPVPEETETPCYINYGAKVTSESIFGDKLETNVKCMVLLKTQINPWTPAPKPTPMPTPTPTPRPTPTPTPSPNPKDPNDEEEQKPEFIITRAFIKGSWENWGDIDRFLALEKIKIGVTGMGFIDKVVFRLSPELEAMEYTNSSGHTYDYAHDFFGKYIYFPQDSTVYAGEPVWGGRLYSWSYKLPLCAETITWEGLRIKEPYQIKAFVYGKEGTLETVILPLDITGNIYELIHPQPAD